MWPDRVLNPGPLTYESGALPIHKWDSEESQTTFVNLYPIFQTLFHNKLNEIRFKSKQFII